MYRKDDTYYNEDSRGEDEKGIRSGASRTATEGFADTREVCSHYVHRPHIDASVDDYHYNPDDTDAGRYGPADEPDSRDMEEEEVEEDSIDKDDKDDNTNDELPEKKTSPRVLFLKLFYSPLSALKKLKNSGLHPEKVASAVFYPMLALCSAGVFMRLVYEEGLTVSMLLKDAVSEFVSYFLGYFLVLVVMKILPGDVGEKTDSPYGRCWLMYLMSTLALYDLVTETFPPIEPVVTFAPLYTMYLALRGSRFLRCKKTSSLLAGWSVALSTIFIPYGLNFLMKLIMGAEGEV